jgi:uncharacterized protein (TIGR02117 family)
VAPPMPQLPPAAERSVPIHLITHGWHTGIVVPRVHIPDALWPESRDFAHAELLEVGWGDHVFYQGHDQGPLSAVRAVLWPTASVLHVVGVHPPLAAMFPESEIVEIRITQDALVELARYFADAIERNGAVAARPVGPGRYGKSLFYPAREPFHLFRTCNVWTARALRTAGLPVHDAITKEGLMTQVRALGRVVQKPAP